MKSYNCSTPILSLKKYRKKGKRVHLKINTLGEEHIATKKLNLKEQKLQMIKQIEKRNRRFEIFSRLLEKSLTDQKDSLEKLNHNL